MRADDTSVLVWLLARDDAKQIASAIDMLLEHRQIVLQDPRVVAAANRIFREKPALGISDCLLLEVAKKEGRVPLGTFDAKLGKQDGAEAL